MVGSQSNAVNRRLNRLAPTIIICGIFLFFSGILYMSLCGDTTNASVSHDLSHHHDPKYRDQGSKQNQLVGKLGLFRDKTLHRPVQVAFLVVLVMTAPKNAIRRDNIRKTWLSKYSSDIVPYFVIGTKELTPEERSFLNYENSQHKDLLLLNNIHDSYKHLTVKVLQAYAWLDEHVSFKFVLKADDDTYARIDVIQQELKGKKAERLYWGFFNGHARVKRTGKWAETDWVLCDTYLPYALGGGYVLSYDLIHFLAANGNYFKHFKNEDVSVGAWLAPLNLNRVHDPRFDTEYTSRGCHNSYIVTHKQTPEDMQIIYTNLNQKGKLCHKELRLRKSYNYNWNVLPSYCCVRNDTSVP